MMSSQENNITAHTINSYMKLESQASWYFRRLGWIAEREPVIWEWLSRLRQDDLKRISAMCPTQFGSPFGLAPTLGPLIDQLLCRNFVRGFLMGCKFHAGEMNVPFTFAFPGQKTTTKEQEDGFSELEEIQPEDLAE